MNIDQLKRRLDPAFRETPFCKEQLAKIEASDIVGWIGQMEDRETIEKLKAELAKAENDIRVLLGGESHQVMCLKAEVTACHAAKAVMQREIDILEQGLSEAKEQIKELMRKMAGPHIEAHVTEFPHDAEGVPAKPAK